MNIYKMEYQGFYHCGGQAVVIADSEDEAKEILLADEMTLNLIPGKLKPGIEHSIHQTDHEDNKHVKPTKDEIAVKLVEMEQGVVFNDNGNE